MLQYDEGPSTLLCSESSVVVSEFLPFPGSVTLRSQCQNPWGGEGVLIRGFLTPMQGPLPATYSVRCKVHQGCSFGGSGAPHHKSHVCDTTCLWYHVPRLLSRVGLIAAGKSASAAGAASSASVRTGSSWFWQPAAGRCRWQQRATPTSATGSSVCARRWLRAWG